jgi:transposase-like protein
MTIRELIHDLQERRDVLAHDIDGLDRDIVTLTEMADRYEPRAPSNPVGASPERVPVKKASSHNAVSPEDKAEVIAWAQEHGTEQASRKFGFAVSTVTRWRREAGEVRVPPHGPPPTKKNAPGSKPPLSLRVPTVEKAEVPLPAIDRHPSSNIDPHPTLPSEPVRTGHIAGFSPKSGNSILTDAEKLRIVDYSLAHGVKEAADYFAVGQDRILEWRGNVRKLEATVRGAKSG